jgi:radical SAM superfamily enzyme YgiQ (UPF0313 family)
MKILLIAANNEQKPYPVAPLGAITVAAAAQRAGHETDLLDMMFVRSFKKAIQTVLKTKDYDVVAFSIRNLDNCIYHYPKNYDKMIRQMSLVVRSMTDVPLILGGSGFSVAAGTWLKVLNASYGVVGEGEIAFPSLIECIASSRAIKDIPGVICANDGDRISNASSDFKADDFIVPAHHLCDYGHYLARGGYISIQTKRGCPYKCIYCTYPNLEGCKYRLRNPESVVDEIKSLMRNDRLGTMYFVDSVFNTPREQAMAVCEKIIRCKLNIKWLTYCNPLDFDIELAKAMVNAGCVGIEFGLDSATEKMLSIMGKPFTLLDIENSFNAAAGANLPFAVHLLFGGPGETVQDILEAQKFLDSCKPARAVFATLGIRIYRGTPVEQIARREGLSLPDDDFFKPIYYMSPALRENPIKMLDKIARLRPQWSTATDWNSLAMSLLQSLANHSRTKPQWLDAANYGKYMRW